jgi:hypothetical protein
MDGRSVRKQVISGVLITTKFLFGAATLGMFWGGIAAIIHPEQVRAESFLLHRLIVGTHSFTAAWIYLAVSAVILILTMDRWVQILSGLFAYSTLGPLIALSGKYNGVPVPRNEAVFLTFFTIATAVVSWTFRERKLHLIDRVAMMAFLFCLGVGASPELSTVFPAFSIGFACLVLAWAVNRIQGRVGQKSSRHRLHGPAADGAGRH